MCTGVAQPDRRDMKKPKMPPLMRYLPCLGLLLLAGCDFALMNPKGQVGVDIKGIILIVVIMIQVAGPQIREFLGRRRRGSE